MTVLIVTGFYLNDHKGIGDNEISTIVIPALSVWAFVYVIIRFKIEQEKSKISDDYLNAMFTNATEGMIISNTKGEIVMANPHSEEMFGYEKGGLKSKTIENLVPSRFAAKHVHHRNHYYSELNTRPMGKGMSLFARRKDESEFPVEISLSNFRIKDEHFIISFIIDITERKKQEALVDVQIRKCADVLIRKCAN